MSMVTNNMDTVNMDPMDKVIMDPMDKVIMDPMDIVIMDPMDIVIMDINIIKCNVQTILLKSVEKRTIALILVNR